MKSIVLQANVDEEHPFERSFEIIQPCEIIGLVSATHVMEY